MANTPPTQYRSVDPYAEFNSNVVSKMTRMLTEGNNCIASWNDADIITPLMSPTKTVELSPGVCFKDDVFITLTQTGYIIDFRSTDFYVATSPTPFGETGWYYIVLDYTWVKQAPAPQAKLYILKPSERTLLSEPQYLFLKAVHVTYTSEFIIDELSDWDPDFPDNKRLYTPVYLGLENTLPAHDESYAGRMIYSREDGIAYVGDELGWRVFGCMEIHADTHLCELGDLAYLVNGFEARPAIATSTHTFATCSVTKVGTSEGRVRLTGIIENGLVETSITISEGDSIYLSTTEAGKVTNVSPPAGSVQLIGECLSVASNKYTVVLTSLASLNQGVGYSGYSGEQGYSGYSGLSGQAMTQRILMFKLITDDTGIPIGDGKVIFPIPSALNGFNLVEAQAAVTTVSSSGKPTYQLRNVTDGFDMLSTKISIDATEFTSYTASIPPVIDPTHDDVATGDLIAIDKDVAGTGEKGDTIMLTFEHP